MCKIVSVLAAKTRFSRLLARVEAGGTITTARGKVPVARLTPAPPTGKREFGAMHGKFSIGPEFFDPLPDDERVAWEATGVSGVPGGGN
jgi:antitoxin (DNA-binding transcriptional repressor) of toxin-antitoxin stability system